LFEWYCDKNDIPQIEKYDCPNGCEDGACVSNPVTSNVISGRVVENSHLKNQDIIEQEGELEVIHADDFENPENSRYMHYIIIDGKKYEIKSEDKLPVVISGTKVKVRGQISRDKFLLENYLKKHPEDNLLKNNSALSKTEVKGKNKTGFFNSNWIYILMPAMIIIAYLAFLEANRIKKR